MKFLYTVLSLLLFLHTVVHGINVGENGRIVGGNNAYNGQFPEVVSVLDRPLVGLPEHQCGGIILNDNHVLTVASCVQGGGILDFEVMAAGTNLDGTAGYEEYRNIQAVFIHPEYNDTTRANDLAVLRTNHNFVFVNGLIMPAKIPTTGTPEPPIDSKVTVGGWGRDKYEGTLHSQMKAVNLTYITHSECELLYGSSLQDNHACISGDTGKGVCDGDEGSGVFTEDSTCIGLVAWHVGCDAYPAAITLLESYYDWIISMFDA